MTAVMRRADAVLQALIMIRSSMRPSLISPGAVDWRTNTVEGRLGKFGFWQGWCKVLGLEEVWWKRTILVSDGLADGDRGFLVRRLEHQDLCQFDSESIQPGNVSIQSISSLALPRVIPNSLALSTSHCYAHYDRNFDRSLLCSLRIQPRGPPASKDKHVAYLSATSFASMG